ncbi:MAG: HPF/RaiA family ribosome-associated protein [Deltaproteobacteria bacterium]|nr:HPF/RaiA family ribosome-associated protein [Kofleriaceae bacterium]
MPIPVTVNFRDMFPSPSVDAFVRRWATRLERVDPRVQRCEVTIDQPHRHHERGNRFRVHVLISVPGKEIAVTQDPGEDGAHDDVRVAVRDSFRAARRQLEENARRSRTHRAA